MTLTEKDYKIVDDFVKQREIPKGYGFVRAIELFLDYYKQNGGQNMELDEQAKNQIRTIRIQMLISGILLGVGVMVAILAAAFYFAA
jgi:hypothetical protein